MIGKIVEIVNSNCKTTSYMIETGDVIPFMAMYIDSSLFPNKEIKIGDKVSFEAAFHNTALKVKYYDNL